MVIADSDGVTLKCWDSQAFFISNKRPFALQHKGCYLPSVSPIPSLLVYPGRDSAEFVTSECSFPGRFNQPSSIQKHSTTPVNIRIWG